MRVLVVDTETTGLPYYDNGIRKYPSIVQWSFVVFDTISEEVIYEYDYIIKALDPISPESISIHGITEDMSHKGSDFTEIYPTFMICVQMCEMIIGHNIDFDLNVMKEECQRLQCDFIIPPQIYCTMKSSRDLCCIKRQGYMSYKYPKLVELYEFLFYETPSGLHNSMKDVWVCLRCFCKLKYNKNIEYLRDKCL